nr:ribonuclease H [Ipomoea batatas]
MRRSLKTGSGVFSRNWNGLANKKWRLEERLQKREHLEECKAELLKVLEKIIERLEEEQCLEPEMGSGCIQKFNAHNPREAELMAIEMGLEWARNKGINRLEIQCDNADVVRDVRNCTGREKRGFRILENCRRLIGEGEERRLVHAFREQNAVADWFE